MGAEAWPGWLSRFFSFPSLLRGEASDPGSPGLWVGVPHPGGSQIFALEQAGTPGKAEAGGRRIQGRATPLCPPTPREPGFSTPS